MAAVGMPSSWEELPPELLGQVLHRLPSLADRVRFCAVCWPWRTGASAEKLPPPLPWLAFRDGTLVDLAGAPVRCAPILREEGVDLGYLVVDNLAFLVHQDGGCSLMNPLSGLRLPLPKLGRAVSREIDNSKFYSQPCISIRKAYVKAVLSSPLDSTPDPLVAVVILDGKTIAVSACKQDNAISITICLDPDPPKIRDIAFFHGKLYALTVTEGLHAIELDADHLSKLKSSSGFHQCIADDPKQKEIYCSEQCNYTEYLIMRYLTACNGRLLMLRRWMRIPPNVRLGDHVRTVQIEVFEAVLDKNLPSQWTKVETLGGHAIFLGSECSKSVLASQFAGGVQADCVYFMHQFFDNPSKEYFGPCVDPLADSGVYNMRDGEITPLLPEAVMAEVQRRRQFLTWFFPANE